MKTLELIQKLQDHVLNNGDAEMIIFANGDIYPILDITKNCILNACEIACGWSSIDRLEAQN